MEIFGFETVDNLPLLYHPEMDMLVLADLHLGLEGSMTSDGHYVPKHQLDKLLSDLEEARELTEASRILVNGDLKNEFSKSRYSEKEEIQEVLDFINENFEKGIIIKGNHDTFVQFTVEDYGLEFVEYHIENNTLFTHGHKKPEELGVEDKYDTIVIGHEHPALALEDEIGVKEKVNCFLHGEQKSQKIIVLPSFSSISEGTNINESPQSELLSPILRDNFNVSKLKALAVSREAGLFDFPEVGKI